MDWNALPPLAALRAFASYADTGSVQAAGLALNVSHAAISQQIRNLEEHLGLQLLDRTARQATLTAEGAHLSEALRRGFEMMARRVTELTGTEEARPLHITTTPSFAANWLMPRLADFRARHPEIDLVIDPNPACCDPSPGGIDMAIRYGKGTWPGLESTQLIRTSMALIAAPSLIGDKPVACPADLQEFPWLQELGTNEATQWLERNGITETRTAGMMALPGNLMLEAARAGQGIAVTAAVWVQDDVAAGRLKILSEENPDNGYHLLTRPGVLRPSAKLFAVWLRRQVNAPS